MTEVALEKGDKVVATLRTPSMLNDLTTKYGPDQLLILKLDVTQPAEIVNVFAQAKQAFGRVDIVFNNAGVSSVGEIEATPEAAARHVFDVTFWGAVNVSKEAVRFFREDNPAGAGGRLLNISSLAGIRAVPCIPYYSASKFGKSFSTFLSWRMLIRCQHWKDLRKLSRTRLILSGISR
jgi:NAD(P)-dependent dehydrogenase (short-subunit alcohol dehydrogenase family)